MEDNFKTVAGQYLKAYEEATDAERAYQRASTNRENTKNALNQITIELAKFVGGNITERAARTPEFTVVVRHQTPPSCPEVKVFDLDGKLLRG